MRKHAPSSGQSGYTLLELTMVLSLIGFIVLITGAASRLGFRSVDAGEKKVESLERFKISLITVDAQIQSSIPLTTEDAETKTDILLSFTGNSESVRFPTNYSIWNDHMGYVMVAYKVETDNIGKQSLIATETMIATEITRRTKLFGRFDRIRFEYFYKERTGETETGIWVEEWMDDKSIPEKIRLHLTKGSRTLSLVIPVNVRQFTINKKPSL